MLALADKKWIDEEFQCDNWYTSFGWGKVYETSKKKLWDGDILPMYACGLRNSIKIS